MRRFIAALLTVAVVVSLCACSAATSDESKKDSSVSVSSSVSANSIAEDVQEINPSQEKYDSAVELMENGTYDEAFYIFDALDNYDDASAKAEECRELITESNYQCAVSALDQGYYRAAYNAFISLGDYHDSELMAEKIANEYPVYFQNVGNIMTLGTYEQDGDETNGYEEIEWIVLDVTDDAMLVLSRYALASQAYNQLTAYDDWTDYRLHCAWDRCTLRQWLNDDFYNSAFSEEEKEFIKTSEITTTYDSAYADVNLETFLPVLTEYDEIENNIRNAKTLEDLSANVSKIESEKEFFSDTRVEAAMDRMEEIGCMSPVTMTTEDEVFLLSAVELTQYENTIPDLQTCMATEGSSLSTKRSCVWWLRDSDNEIYDYAYVNSNSEIIVGHVDICFGRNGIRPAVWLDLGTGDISSVEEGWITIDERSTVTDTSTGTAIDSEKNTANEVNFTNDFGTPTTVCAHRGCSNYIASSGDTNCCEAHSNKCLNCGKYIDGDAMYCMDCLAAALGS
jgi:tetratricopeptide (TPR) repeat protein